MESTKRELIKLVLEAGDAKHTTQQEIVEAANAVKLKREDGSQVFLSQSEVSAFLKDGVIVKKTDRSGKKYYTLGKGDASRKETAQEKLARKFYQGTSKNTVEFCTDVKVATLTSKRFATQMLGDNAKAAFKDVIIDVHHPTERTVVFYYRSDGCEEFEKFMRKQTANRKKDRKARKEEAKEEGQEG